MLLRFQVNFGGGSDGYWPHASSIDLNGRLYGTPKSGGANGYGTIFGLSRTPAPDLAPTPPHCIVVSLALQLRERLAPLQNRRLK